MKWEHSLFALMVNHRAGSCRLPVIRVHNSSAWSSAISCRLSNTIGIGTLDETFYACIDAMFNVVALVDGVSYIVEERYAYEPYGIVSVLEPNWTARSTSDYDWATRLQGLFTDLESGLIYQRNRMNHPGLGRFMLRDPLGYVDGQNLYAAYFVLWSMSDATGTRFCHPAEGSLRRLMENAASNNSNFTASGRPDPHNRITWQLLSCIACIESSYNSCGEGESDDRGLIQLTPGGAMGQCQQLGLLPQDITTDDKEECCGWNNQPRFDEDEDGNFARVQPCSEGCEIPSGT